MSNYAEHAMHALIELHDLASREGECTLFIKDAINSLSNSVHFTIPDGGRVLGDTPVVDKDSCNLPFPSITISYFVGAHKPSESFSYS